MLQPGTPHAVALLFALLQHSGACRGSTGALTPTPQGFQFAAVSASDADRGFEPGQLGSRAGMYASARRMAWEVDPCPTWYPEFDLGFSVVWILMASGTPGALLKAGQGGGQSKARSDSVKQLSVFAPRMNERRKLAGAPSVNQYSGPPWHFDTTQTHFLLPGVVHLCISAPEACAVGASGKCVEYPARGGDMADLEGTKMLDDEDSAAGGHDRSAGSGRKAIPIDDPQQVCLLSELMPFWAKAKAPLWGVPDRHTHRSIRVGVGTFGCCPRPRSAKPPGCHTMPGTFPLRESQVRQRLSLGMD